MAHARGLVSCVNLVYNLGFRRQSHYVFLKLVNVLLDLDCQLAMCRDLTVRICKLGPPLFQDCSDRFK